MKGKDVLRSGVLVDRWEKRVGHCERDYST
jgi:hypothetical protein